MKALKLNLDDIDLYGWIASVERFLDYYEVLPADRVSVAAVHLTGDSSDFEAALTHHTHTGSLEDYHSQFIKLSCQVHGWSDL
ncbi:hypothetical protein L3X38_037528 [Prunus dulcis]|uniref:Retrotransposon gag domain-containing protein n=1 Tax=Prunus dulcis TaxID=3755 RepID=A0AAD4V392_PRUDU|nr:hypothetical protein L3X38_037488 [Prunus dulcis]KAI5317805.1 hypothetical protein L3X38_037512 [Prunus dulcis]KAI5317821.1 hypothetical protein L3X38_037528 [Prunus dulcis]